MGVDDNETLQINEGVVESSLKDLAIVFLRLRNQINSGRGSLGKINTDLEESGDSNEIKTSEVLNMYLEKLTENKANEIQGFFSGNETEYNAVVSAITDPIKRKVLLAYYKSQEDSTWADTSGSIVDRRAHISPDFPSFGDINLVLEEINKH